VPSGATSAPELDTLTVNTSTRQHVNAPSPAAPTSLTATINGPYSVTLDWTAPANSNSNAAQMYTVYKNNSMPPVGINVTGTSWT